MRSIPGHILSSLSLAAWVGALALMTGTAGATPESSRLVALRKSTGAPLATVPLWSGAANAAGRPAVTVGWVYFVEEGRTLCGMNLLTRKVQWRTPLEAPVKYSPFVSGGLVLLHDGTVISAYTATTGRRKWQFSLEDIGSTWRLGEEAKFLARADSIVLSSGQRIFVLDPASGQPEWASENVGMAEGSTPVVLGSYLFLRSKTDPSHWSRLSLSDGSTVWDDEGPERPTADPEAALRRPSTTPVVLSADRRSLTVKLPTRSWSYRAPAPFTIADIVGESGDILCVQLVEGPQRAASR